MKKRKILSLVTAAFMLMSMPVQMYAQEEEVSLFSAAETAESGSSKIITGYICSCSPYMTMTYAPHSKPSLGELTDKMPSVLTVKLENGTITDIPVRWICDTGDYSSTDSYYYTFSPVPMDDTYTLSDNADRAYDVPYIGVFISDTPPAGAVNAENGEELSSVTGTANEVTVYNFLINEMGCNNAMAVGIMANIYLESSFNPQAQVLDTNNKISYGICQWNGDRYTALQNYCASLGISHTTIEGQLLYLKYELNTSETAAWTAMGNIPNTAAGAYNAGYIWAQKFERCTQIYNGVDQFARRGTLAQDTFWPEYMETPGMTEIILSGNNAPKSIVNGKAFSISGIVRSGAPLTNVTVGCYDINGKYYTGHSASPVSTSADPARCDLKNSDYYVLFNKLSPGMYIYRITAETAYASKVLAESVFVVLSTSPTGADGTYIFRSTANTNLAFAGADSSVVLKQYSTSSAAQIWQAEYVSDGYYTLRNCASAKYLDLSGSSLTQAAKSGADTQLWQILPAGTSVCIIPKTNTYSCVNIYGGVIAADSKLNINTPYLDKNQLFSPVMTSSEVAKGHKITFNTNGGTALGSYAYTTADGVNTILPTAGSLVVYNISDTLLSTGYYCAAAIVGSDGRVTDVRINPAAGTLSVPKNGFILWGSSEGTHKGYDFVTILSAGMYVSFEPTSKTVTIYKTESDLLASTKYVYDNEEYGKLPVPVKTGMSFEGWFTAASGGTRITETSKYSVSTLYAHWALPTQITSSPADAQVPEGTKAVFTVKASGSGLTYQWQELSGSEWKDITGQTSSQLSLSSVTASMTGGYYRCLVKAEGYAQTASASAMLRVTPYDVVTTTEVKTLTSEQLIDFVNYFTDKKGSGKDTMILTEAQMLAIELVLK